MMERVLETKTQTCYVQLLILSLVHSSELVRITPLWQAQHGGSRKMLTLKIKGWVCSNQMIQGNGGRGEL